MDRDDIREQEYRVFVRTVNRAPPPDDEYVVIAACDALTEDYNLGRCLKPPRGQRCLNTATFAACPGGIFISQGGEPPFRE